MLADALRIHQPWLEWTGKREAKGFKVDPVALHIHERVSTQAILKVATRQDVTRDIFADPKQEYREAVQFYQHDVDWANRLILGDSLQVMVSLARREDLAGKVQMIYIDPPYGIKFASNFQPEIGRRDVNDKETDLTREPEMVKAYRDTWTLGIHSYLSYLRDRLLLCKELLADDGSIFVQIGEENKHRIRMLLEEIFGEANFVCEITYKTSIGLGGEMLDPVCNYLVWFAKNREQAEKKYRQLYQKLTLGEAGATRYTRAESIQTGETRTLSAEEQGDPALISADWRPFTDQGLTSRSSSATTSFPVSFQGERYTPTAGGWRTNAEGMGRVLRSERVIAARETIRFKKYFDDFGALALTNFWTDVGGGIQSREDSKVYVCQTATKIVERCMLMTTDPGDLVLDLTSGSATTAYVAEQWGRRWIAIDTSRVAIAIARQRLLTAKFDYYQLRDTSQGIRGNFRYKTVPHITLRSIAQNTHLDPIFATHEPILEARLAACNTALAHVDDRLRATLQSKLLLKQRSEGRKAITEADRRRWALPKKDEQWRHWQVPFDTDPDYPDDLVEAITAYRQACRAKMDEVHACIATNAEPEELVDQPEISKGIVRVSGPFTVEAVQPPEISLGAVIPERDTSLIGGAPEELDEGFADMSDGDIAAQNAEAYLD